MPVPRPDLLVVLCESVTQARGLGEGLCQLSLVFIDFGSPYMSEPGAYAAERAQAPAYRQLSHCEHAGLLSPGLGNRKGLAPAGKFLL